MNPRNKPAAWTLANGVSRHGRNCSCRSCRAEYDQPTQPVVFTFAPLPIPEVK